MDCGLTQRYMRHTTEYILDTCELPNTSILETVSKYDAAETLNLAGRWPRSFNTTVTCCPICGNDLSQLSKRRQKHKSDTPILITKLHVIEIEILTRKCRKCYLMVRPDTLQHGLLNIGDLTLVSLDVFFSLRNMIRFVHT